VDFRTIDVRTFGGRPAGCAGVTLAFMISSGWLKTRRDRMSRARWEILDVAAGIALTAGALSVPSGLHYPAASPLVVASADF
jgi:hypothetical protein